MEKIEEMSALLFPGQGSQVVGMGSEFYKNFKSVKEIFKEADERLNYPISKFILEGPEDQLQLTQNTQPAILIVSYSIFHTLSNQFNLNSGLFKYFCGHSLGEYSALVCSNSLNFGDALYLLHERGKAMQAAVPVGKGGMVAVIGSEIDSINEIINSLNLKSGVCQIANDNAKGQVIVSGDIDSINIFKSSLKKNKIKAIPLKVSAPFHCSLMQPAAKVMKEKISNVKFIKPSINVISNVTAKPESDPENIKKKLVEQIYSTVKWRETIINMSNENIKEFIEIGPGKVLTSMVSRTIKDVNSFSINSIADIKKLDDRFKK